MGKNKKMSTDGLNAIISAIPKEEVEEYFKKYIEEQKPNKDGTCKQEGCSGFVVKRVCGWSSFGYHYSLPTCTVCSHVYIFADDVPIVGRTEFEKMMNTPFTI